MVPKTYVNVERAHIAFSVQYPCEGIISLLSRNHRGEFIEKTSQTHN